ncbi:ABC transporter permease subunit [Aeromicrobium sp. CTD01-1L150]|uniref:ABC transporter permease subunit n=1 Tax=Aeromicrobium sp. CTD01-1L150 TaxID=3341830 RepID=UPI0035BFE266
MRPTVRSRLWAATGAFLVGFVIANVGVLVITGPDRWVWLAVALLLMVTGAVGVLVADTRRPLSLWAVLGVELLVVLTLLPLLWMFTVATSVGDAPPRDLWPTSISWAAFDAVVSPGELRRAAVTSALVAGLATLVAMLVTIPAAYALAQRRVRGRRVLYGLFVAVLLLPVVALAGPIAVQLLDLGVADEPLALVAPTLLIALPLALWLNVTVMLHAPWNLRDAVRADGATRRQELRTFVLPALAPVLVLVTLLVFVVTAGDAVLGAAVAPGPETRTLPATLLLASQSADSTSSTAAAVGLMWLLPVVVLLALAPRRIAHLIGRTYR